MTAMAILVMPKLGLTMEEGRVAEWKVAAGDRFRAGDVLVVIETDKIASEVEASEDGTVERLAAEVDDVLPVGATLATWLADGESSEEKPYEALPASSAVSLAKQQEKAVAPVSDRRKHSVSSGSATGRSIATPLARREARERGVDLSTVHGTGPRGRIRQKDVIVAQAAKAPISSEGLSGEAVPPSRWQRVAAERMVLSKTTIPHFYVSTEFEAAPLEAAVAALRASAPGRKLTVTHLILLAIGRTLVAMPEANRIWSDAGYISPPEPNVGLAVATADGLAAPVLRNCAGTVWDIAARSEALIMRARHGRLTGDDNGFPAAITLSNAGMHDVTQMISIIPPGQTAIIGVGSIRPTFRPDEEGRPVLVREVTATLSCDHRVLDGVAAIRFLNAVKNILHNPMNAVLAPTT